MSKLEDYTTIYRDGTDYAVCKLKYKGHNVPIILEYDIYKKIKKIDKKWHINDKGSVVTNHKIIKDGDELVKEIYLHDLVLKLYDENDEKPILHINKLGVDNRKCNLIYDTCDKHITKNLKKKSRTIVLPKHTGVRPEDIPSYVWYLKEDETHGERFLVDFGEIKWKSTGSKKVSLKYKLEETKKYLRYLKNEMGSDFDAFSMNGDLNTVGRSLLSSYMSISKSAGFTNINSNLTGSENTDRYLKEDHNGLSDDEITLLQVFNPEEGRLNFRV